MTCDIDDSNGPTMATQSHIEPHKERQHKRSKRTAVASSLPTSLSRSLVKFTRYQTKRPTHRSSVPSAVSTNYRLLDIMDPLDSDTMDPFDPDIINLLGNIDPNVVAHLSFMTQAGFITHCQELTFFFYANPDMSANQRTEILDKLEATIIMYYFIPETTATTESGIQQDSANSCSEIPEHTTVVTHLMDAASWCFSLWDAGDVGLTCKHAYHCKYSVLFNFIHLGDKQYA